MFMTFDVRRRTSTSRSRERCGYVARRRLTYRRYNQQQAVNIVANVHHVVCPNALTAMLLMYYAVTNGRRP